MLVTFDVLKFSPKVRFVKLEQPQNIIPILITLDVLNPLKSKLFKLEQP